MTRHPENPAIAKIDLHGYHPSNIVGPPLAKLIEQVWEMGADRICFIHGHGRARGISPGFVNTNTGYFGLCVRRELRSNKDLRRWIKYTTLDCGDWGATTVKLKANRNPTRTALDLAVLPERTYARWPARVCGKCHTTPAYIRFAAASTTQPASTATAKLIDAQVAVLDRDNSSAATVGRIVSTDPAFCRELYPNGSDSRCV